MLSIGDLTKLIAHLVYYRNKCGPLDRPLEIRLIESIDYVLSIIKDENEKRKTL